MKERRKDRHHPLLFTKEGDLDFGWVILIVSCLVGMGIFVFEALAQRGPSIAAWSWFGAFTSMAFIAGAARDRARLIAKSDVPGNVAKGIAESEPSLPSKNDDERFDK